MSEHINVSKLDAAKRQIEVAIELFLSNKDVVSIHTLTAASHTILKDLCNKHRKESLIKDTMTKLVKPEMKKRWLKMLNGAENFFKHAERDPGGVIKFYLEQTEWFIWDVCFMYLQLTKEATSMMKIFNVWFLSKHPDCLMDQKLVSFLKKQIQHLNIDYKNRLEFLELLSCAHEIRSIEYKID